MDDYTMNKVIESVGGKLIAIFFVITLFSVEYIIKHNNEIFEAMCNWLSFLSINK